MRAAAAGSPCPKNHVIAGARVTLRRDRRVARWKAAPAHRGRGLPPLPAGAAGGLPSQASRLRERHDAMALRAHRRGSTHGPPDAARRVKRRRRYGRSQAESRAPAAGSRPERQCSPVVPCAGWCHRPRATMDVKTPERSLCSLPREAGQTAGVSFVPARMALKPRSFLLITVGVVLIAGDQIDERDHTGARDGLQTQADHGQGRAI
jgi:hypothetical protein